MPVHQLHGSPDDLLVRRALAASIDHAEAVALFEKEVDDGDIPVVMVSAQPRDGFVLAGGMRNHDSIGDVLQETCEVVTDDGVVFDQVGLESHWEEAGSQVEHGGCALGAIFSDIRDALVSPGGQTG